MEQSQSPTRMLAAHLHGIRYEGLSGHCVEVAKMCVQDLVGVAIAGSQKRETEIWRTYYSVKPSLPQATLFAPHFPKIAMEQAVAVNAVAGHVMDLDDVHNASITHLGVITIPTAFALGQVLEKSGRDVLAAIVAGYEAGARIGACINPSSYHYWHTTGVVGGLSSAVTAAKLLSLTEEQLLDCLGSAGTQAAGLWEFLASGAMSKALHTANANLCGLRAAELAGLGFTGAHTILEGERGLVRALAPEYHPERLTEGFDGPLRIEENSFKPYACCRHTHSANTCVEQLLRDRPLDPEEIEEIRDDTYATAVNTTNNPYPENGYAAKFSLQFCIAAALVLHDLSDRVFTEDNIRRPEIRRLTDKIKVQVDPELEAAFRRDPNQWSHRLTIRLRSGEVITRQVDYPIGDFKNPFDWQMADQKFTLLTDGLLEPACQARLLDCFHRLDEIEDINEIFEG